jgi:hypothetical protein
MAFIDNQRGSSEASRRTMKYAAGTHCGLGWNAYQQSLNIRLTNLLPIAAQTSRSRADSPYHQAATPRGNIRAADAELTADDLAVIERAAAAITVEGERYPAYILATTGR